MYHICFRIIVSGIILLLSMIQPTIAESKNQEKLLKMVVLSRHGLRSPIQSHEVLEGWTEKDWPYWTVKDGDLTPRGTVLVSALWETLRDELWLNELFPKNICPDQELIYVRANTLERTQTTAIALLNGFAPGCGLNYMVIDSSKWDPLFTPLETKTYSVDLPKAIKEFDQLYGGIEKIQSSFKEPLTMISDKLGPLPQKTCNKYGLSAQCTLFDLPNKIAINDKNDIHLSGGLGIAITSSEIFLWELCEWPKGNFSSLSVSKDFVQKTLPVHTAFFNAAHQVPEVAQIKGGSLLRAMTDALTSTDSNSAINKAKLAVFVGHDSNISSIAGLLSLNWNLGDYPPGVAAPGGILAFTLWETPKGNIVRAHYVCQSLDTLANPSIYPQTILKEQLALYPSGKKTSTESALFECSEKQFKDWVDKVINKKYLVKQTTPLKAKRIL